MQELKRTIAMDRLETAINSLERFLSGRPVGEVKALADTATESQQEMHKLRLENANLKAKQDAVRNRLDRMIGSMSEAIGDEANG